MTVTSFPVVAMKLIFGMCDYTIDSDIGMCNFLLVQVVLHMCGRVHVQLHLSQGMDCVYTIY